MREGSNSPRDALPFERHHAFIIGIDAYEKVAALETAVSDARRLAEVLSAQQHFEVHAPLLDARGEDIRTLLHSTLRERVHEKDRVFFYFAGHGIAADGDDGPAGYILPADADPARPETLVPMEELQRALAALPCRHLLLVLDCCFSGAFKWSSRYRAVTGLMPKKIYRERFDRFVEDPAWQVLTSAAYDQKALDVIHGGATGDRGRVAAHDETAHSPFAKALFEGLAGAADVRASETGEGDGVITATELYAYIRDQVEPETIEQGQEKRQTPGFFPLKRHDKGEFVFLHPKHRLNLPPTPKRSPYKGLEPFVEDDQLLFYGRDAVLRAMRAKLDLVRLLVVVGDSGTGKSSLVRAGLVPSLRRAGFDVLPVVRPGERPLAALEEALIAATDGKRSVLVVDPLDDAITRCPDPEERRRFDARLREILDSGRVHRVVLTVRSDREPLLDGGALQGDWMEGRFEIPPFSLEDLKEAVVLPTMQEVLIFEPPELVEDIVGSLVGAPGALPLLSLTLNELYEAYRASGRRDRALTREDYEALGGVEGVLRGRARALYESLDPAQRGTLRKVLLRMVSVEGDLSSRRVPIAELDYSEEENPRVEDVVERLVEARLLVRGADFIEAAHPALFTAWKRLHDWIHVAGHDKLVLRERLAPDAEEYARTGNRALLWYDKPQLALAAAELGRPRHGFNARESAFIERSLVRNKRRARLVRFVTFGALLTMLGLTIWAVNERGIAVDNALEAARQAEIAEENARLAEHEKDRALLGLFSALKLNFSGAQPGSVCLHGLCAGAPVGDGDDEAWLVIGRLPATAPSYYPTEVSRDFAAVRQYGLGHVLVYAHDGTTSDPELAPGSDNMIFAENALRWLTPLEEEEGCAEVAVTILLWEGTFIRAEGLRSVAEFIDRRGWELRATSLETLESDLRCAEVLWYLSDWYPPPGFAERAVPAIERFVRDGGGLLVGGLGWSYEQQGGPGRSAAVEPYAANRLGEPFGFAFTGDAFQFQPGQLIPLLSGE